VRTSSDAAMLNQLIGLHYYHEPIILDASWGGGRIWHGCPYQPTTRLDQRPLPGVDVVGDWNQLGDLFDPGQFQMVVWDPPHQTNGGQNALASKRWAHKYGTDIYRAEDITSLYPGFLSAARQVLQPVGTLLCKLADQAHAGVQHLQAVDFVVAARAAGWTVCEMVPKLRRPGPMDPKWRRQFHIRKAWSYWICAHPGPRCPAVGVPLVVPCQAPRCTRHFRAQRSDAKYCSAACRERARRHRNVAHSRSAVQQLHATTEAAD
jgi:hypothetical protein